MLKAVLVDDEVLGINLLEAMLTEIGGIHIAGKFTNPLEGLEAVGNLRPDVLFLDIEMNEMNGIKLADRIAAVSSHTEIVFVTAYDQYALEAFNVQAVDYILKPIEKGRLEKAVQRILRRKQAESLPERVRSVTASFLGGFRLVIDQETIKWRTKKVKELCAYLIFQNRPVHKDKIIEDLWPDQSLEKSSAQLHTSIYYLRKELKNHGFNEGIKYVDERYSIVMEMRSDLAAIKKLLNQPVITHIDVEELLHLYKDDFLAEEDYTWSIDEKEQLRKFLIHSLEKVMGEFQNVSNTEGIVKKVIDKLIEMEPWDEQYNQELILYYLKNDNCKEAVKAYEKYKSVLWKQLGLKPRQELEKIINSIK